MDRYFITTGRTGAKYTLRMHGIWYDYRGQPHPTTYHVKTLTTNFDESVQRALEIVGDDGQLERPEEVSLRKITQSKIDHTILEFGKYKGMTIEEVAEQDRPYLVWAAMNVKGTRHIKTVELIAEEVAAELEQAKEEAEKAAREEEEAQAKAEEKRRNRRHVGTVGKRQTFELIYKFSASYDNNYGTVMIYGFEDLDGNSFVWKTSSYMTTKDCSYIEKGSRLTVKATVKEHGRYAHAPQTVLTRLAVVEVKA